VMAIFIKRVCKTTKLVTVVPLKQES